MTSFTLNPGQSRTLTAAYTDANGVNEPLASVPVATCDDADITITPVGSFTVTDKQYQWTVAASATAATGDFSVDVTAEGDPVAGKDTIDGKITGTVAAPEDTQVALSVT